MNIKSEKYEILCSFELAPGCDEDPELSMIVHVFSSYTMLNLWFFKVSWDASKESIKSL